VPTGDTSTLVNPKTDIIKNIILSKKKILYIKIQRVLFSILSSLNYINNSLIFQNYLFTAIK
jgi:hypothetical protein